MLRIVSLSIAAALCLSVVGCSEAGPAPKGPAEAEQVKAKPRTRFVCRDYDRATDKVGQRTMLLEQTDDKGLTEGEKLAFSFSLYQGAETYPSRQADGIAETEDVAFSFSSKDGKVGVHLYLDEMGETSLTLDGKDGGDYLCNAGHLVCHDFDRETEQLAQRTVVLTKTDERPLVEGQKTAFSIAIFEGAETYTEKEFDGTVETEDVVFDFQSKDGKVGFHAYMDEADQASLSLDGREAGDFICR